MRRAFMQTGIAGLDAILGGGIPRGNVVLITGGPGPARPAWASSSSIGARATSTSRE